jgi:hypothetical protein
MPEYQTNHKDPKIDFSDNHNVGGDSRNDGRPTKLEASRSGWDRTRAVRLYVDPVFLLYTIGPRVMDTSAPS